MIPFSEAAGARVVYMILVHHLEHGMILLGHLDLHPVVGVDLVEAVLVDLGVGLAATSYRCATLKTK
jgi:hypothetical protein